MALSHLARATRIVWSLARPQPLPVREVRLDPAGKVGVALTYDPPGTPRGTVVVIPGMTITAHRDPRLHNLAMGFARGGFRGVVLEVPDLQTLKIRAETDRDLAERLAALAEVGLATEDRIGLLGPSFSGSLALRAATLPGAVERVRSVVTVGAYADAGPTVDYLFQSDDADPYGRLILLLNYLQVIEPVSRGQLEALRTAILDTGRPPEEAELDTVLSGLPPEERSRTDAILHDPETWRAVGRAFLDQGGHVLAPLSIPPITEKLRCSVMMLHGSRDNIVPPAESHALKTALDEAGVPNHLFVTPVLDHANIQGGLTAAREAWGMIRAWAFFVRGMLA